MFVNFEYETHSTRSGRPYVRGFLESKMCWEKCVPKVLCFEITN